MVLKKVSNVTCSYPADTLFNRRVQPYAQGSLPDPRVSQSISSRLSLPAGSSVCVCDSRYFSYLSKAGDKMRFDLALAASEAR